jgi:hypothetical protein
MKKKAKFDPSFDQRVRQSRADMFTQLQALVGRKLYAVRSPAKKPDYDYVAGVNQFGKTYFLDEFSWAYGKLDEADRWLKGKEVTMLLMKGYTVIELDHTRTEKTFRTGIKDLD